MAQRMDFTSLNSRVDHCCLKMDGCERCNEGNCNIAYCKEVMNIYKKKRLRLIPNGIENIPSFDTKVYHKQDIVNAVGECLLLCKQCKDNHMKECIINVVRSALERILFGDHVEDYKGSVLQHIIELTQLDSETGQSVMSCYNKLKTS